MTAQVPNTHFAFGEHPRNAGNDARLVYAHGPQSQLGFVAGGRIAGGFVQRSQVDGQVAFPLEAPDRGREGFPGRIRCAADEHQRGELLTEGCHGSVLEVATAIVNALREVGYDPGTISSDRDYSEPLFFCHVGMLAVPLQASKHPGATTR